MNWCHVTPKQEALRHMLIIPRPFEGNFAIVDRYPLLSPYQRALQVQIHLVQRYGLPTDLQVTLTDLVRSKIGSQLRHTRSKWESELINRRLSSIREMPKKDGLK